MVEDPGSVAGAAVARCRPLHVFSGKRSAGVVFQALRRLSKNEFVLPGLDQTWQKQMWEVLLVLEVREGFAENVWIGE